MVSYTKDLQTSRGSLPTQRTIILGDHRITPRIYTAYTIIILSDYVCERIYVMEVISDCRI